MGDSDEDTKQTASIPSWQQAASRPASDSGSETPLTDSNLERARQFLQDEEVRNASREKKVDFLKSKGLEEEDITKLLDESTQTTTPATSIPTTTHEPAVATTPSVQPATTTASPPSTDVSNTSPQPTDHAPIVTYPEFLTAPLKPPPLLTASGLLNSLALIAGASTLVYGATKHLVSPMVESLTAARVELHDAANANLLRLVEKLEGAVSEIPTAGAGYGKKALLGADKEGERSDDDSSTYDDPSELFHRDVGVQTSPPSSPPLLFNTTTTLTTTTDPTQHQSDRLARLSVAVRNLTSDVVHHAESLSETKNVLDAFNSDLHGLTWPAVGAGGSQSYLYGAANNEPDDEIKRAKTNIRGVKGVLLSTRTFPATIRYGLE